MEKKSGKIYVRRLQPNTTSTYEWVEINISSSMDNIEGLADEFAKFVETSTLFSNGKIAKSHIPTEIMAGVTYGGTVTATGEQISVSLSSEAKYIIGTESNNLTITTSDYATHQGLFYIVTNQFKFNSVVYNTGDWLVATSGGWQKIDNTDEITSVNDRTGSIYAYMGLYNSEIIYRRGDIVSHTNGNLYLAICPAKTELTTNPSTDSQNWKVFGKDFTEDIQGLENRLITNTNAINDLPTFKCSTSEPTPTNVAPAGSIWIKVSN